VRADEADAARHERAPRAAAVRLHGAQG
jgi:hypothetical protein